MNIFLNKSRQLRNIWWAAVFFLVLALLTFPFIILSQVYHWKITITIQAVIVIAATWICQLLRKKPFTELTGAISGLWIKNLIAGISLGAALMILPALFLYLGGWLSWQVSATDVMALLSAAGLFISGFCFSAADRRNWRLGSTTNNGWLFPVDSPEQSGYDWKH